MGSVSTATFRKHKTCPSAELLLLYRDAALAREWRQQITTHLMACDFCGAEFQLLSRHPPTSISHYIPVRIPRHLYRLAKGLLAASARAAGQKVETVYENDRLTFTDA